MRTTAALSAAALVAAGLASSLGATSAGAAPVGGTRQVDPAGDLARSAVAAVRSHPRATEVGAAQSFDVTGALVDRDGDTHVRMERGYHGLRVLGGDLVVHQAADGAYEGVSLTLDRTLDLSVTPAVPARSATEKALAPSRVTRSISGERVAGAPELVVDATGLRPRLAWAVLTGGTQADGTPSRLTTYVDARTGDVLRTEQQIQTADGSGQTLYSGTVPLSTTAASGGYQLKDATRGGTYTTDMANKSDSMYCQLFGSRCATGTLFTDADNLWGTGSNANRQSAAADAQYGTNMTWDYYKLVHGRDGIFGTGKGSYSRVHYGSGYANAFWDGTKMTYGDGDGVDFGPLVSLDVAGHEMSHGVTENSAGLTYSGESGGLNESTSDIFGTLVEFYAANANDPGDYLIGEEFDLKKHLGLRRMDKPSSDGSSYDCYTSTVGSADVHYSSGVGNHFFYLLAEGSGAKTIGGVAHNSPTCNGSTVTGIGRDAAGKIWYRALTVYMTSGTSYSGARTASLNAARDLYGAGSTQYAAVAAAWSAVSVS
ncbi:M4 family metallopeptidase [Nocardioides mesophilus]|uniref:Neutral metalloproteinase n=1 Tax=Nocardioides mesophilus TaxID=433659 RepID=A0A7G9R9E2_9ACTN|nr:M4 family metallopeptidase [Nocardioides mesophilus]QNN52217.1 M4 family metallopeptidase [Nocardioides mesophilus]